MLCQYTLRSGFHGYGMPSLLIADTTLMCGFIVNKCHRVCLMICTNHLCCRSRMTPRLDFVCTCVFTIWTVYSYIVKWLVIGPVLIVTSIVYVSHETEDLLVLVIDYCGSLCTTHCITLIYTSHASLCV